MDRLSRFAVIRLGVGGHMLNEKRFRVIPVSGAFVILRRTLPPLHRAPASDKACCAFSCIDRNLRHNYNIMFTLPSPVLCFYFYAHVLCLGVKNSPTRLIRKKQMYLYFLTANLGFSTMTSSKTVVMGGHIALSCCPSLLQSLRTLSLSSPWSKLRLCYLDQFRHISQHKDIIFHQFKKKSIRIWRHANQLSVHRMATWL